MYTTQLCEQLMSTMKMNNLSDEMYEHFINKNGPQFWKVWNTHFKKNLNKNATIGGCNNDVDIADKFAAHFKDVFKNSGDDSLAKAAYESVAVYELAPSATAVRNNSVFM